MCNVSPAPQTYDTSQYIQYVKNIWESASACMRIDTIVLGATGELGLCPTDDILQLVRRNMSAAIQQALPPCDTPCGGAGWRPVVSLDIGDSSQECPTPWVEAPTPARSCYARVSDDSLGVNFPVSGPRYSKVCGRVVGYSETSTDAFAQIVGSRTIDSAYLDGMSVTHGSQHQHIWSFGTGHRPEYTGFCCPWDTSNRAIARSPPSFAISVMARTMEQSGMVWTAPQPAAPSTLPLGLMSHSLPHLRWHGGEALCQNEDERNESTRLHLMTLYVQWSKHWGIFIMWYSIVATCATSRPFLCVPFVCGCRLGATYLTQLFL
jgi:hypothetical protein